MKTANNNNLSAITAQDLEKDHQPDRTRRYEEVVAQCQARVQTTRQLERKGWYAITAVQLRQFGAIFTLQVKMKTNASLRLSPAPALPQTRSDFIYFCAFALK